MLGNQQSARELGVSAETAECAFRTNISSLHLHQLTAVIISTCSYFMRLEKKLKDICIWVG